METPLGIGMSPAQLLMGRRLKTKLPTSTILLTPKGSGQIKKNSNTDSQNKSFFYDQNTKQLPDISPGDKVKIQIWNPATVIKNMTLQGHTWFTHLMVESTEETEGIC